MSTVDQILVRVRTHLQETSPNEFDDDDQLIPYISDGQIALAGELRALNTPDMDGNPGLFEREDEVTIDAGDESADLEDDFVELYLLEYEDSGGNRCDVTGLKFRDRSEARNAAGRSREDGFAYFLRNKELHVLPTREAPRTLFATIGYDPAALTAGVDQLETDPRYDKIVALYAAINATLDDDAKPKGWPDQLAGYLDWMRRMERRRADAGHAESVSRVVGY